MSFSQQPESQSNSDRRISVAVFVLYLLALIMSIGHHELWGDELHSWNIAKGSHSFGELIANTRYEGHPPLWYTLMWLLSKCTHDLAYLQYLQYVIISAAVFLLLFKSRLPVLAKILLPFGYFFLYEYGTLSRNYAIGILLAFCICLLLQRQKMTSYIVYYLLLFLLSNTHLLGALLAGSLHLYFLLQQAAQKERKASLVLHVLLGAAVILPAAYFIFPPTDSQMNVSFWMKIWNPKMLTDMVAAPMKAFLPIPAWWSDHFWNTHFLGNKSLAAISLLSLLLISVAVYILREDKRILVLFLINLLLTCFVAAIFPLTSARYTGFIFIGFIVACWLYAACASFPKPAKILLYVLLAFQLCGSIVALPKDMHHPFSNAYRVNEILQQVPKGDSLVSDYWCLNNVAAYADKPFYCIELNKRVSFLLWDKQLASVTGTHHAYTDGLNHLFQATHLAHVWMISSNPPDELVRKDALLTPAYQVQLVKQIEGAIEPHSDLYLYNIRPHK